MKILTIKKKYLIILFVACTFKIDAQIQWAKSYGGSLYESANSIIQTSDGGYAVFGIDSSCDGDVVRPCAGSNDLWVVKLSSAGIIQWEKSYGGSADEEGYQIIQTTDGGYALAAITFSADVPGFHGASDGWVLKLDPLGTVQWKKAIGGSGLDEATSIAQTSDGGYIVGGNAVSNDGDVSGHHGSSTDSTASDDMWVIKLDGAGNIQWQKSVGGTKDDGSNSILQSTDGGYMIVGNSQSLDGDLLGKGNKGLNDWMVVKLSPAGNLSWVKLYGGSAQDDAANSITKASDGGYVIAGGDGSVDGDVTGHHGPPCTAAECTDNDCWVIKIDSIGNLQWEKSLGGSGDDNTFSISTTMDGGYVLGGYSLSNDGDVTGNNGLYDFWVAKIDSIGNLKWQKSLGGAGIDQAYSLKQTSDAGYIVAGVSESTNGNVTGNHGNTDMWVVKLSTLTSITDENKSFNAINIYPNPTKNILNIENISPNSTIKIYDISGRLIITQKSNQQITLAINTSDLLNGIYLLELGNENSRHFERIVINK
jgi:hypothetical protein